MLQRRPTLQYSLLPERQVGDKWFSDVVESNRRMTHPEPLTGPLAESRRRSGERDESSNKVKGRKALYDGRGREYCGSDGREMRRGMQKMVMCRVLLSVQALFLFLLGAAVARASVLEEIQKSYETIRDVRGSFVQKSTIKDLKRTDTYKGTFMIKMPSHLRWHYSIGSKQETKIIIRHEDITIYQKAEKQAFKGIFDRESYGQAPIALLSGLATITGEFESTEKNGKVLLRPKRPLGSVVSIEITPSDGPFPIAALVIEDKRSNRIEIVLAGVSVNSGIKESAFDFVLPPDVTVHEYTRPR